jgi:hypothetical protein
VPAPLGNERFVCDGVIFGPTARPKVSTGSPAVYDQRHAFQRIEGAMHRRFVVIGAASAN